jgi:hypothetical protein
MMGRTEERLRDATTALGQAVQPADIPGLRLPDPDARRAVNRAPSGSWYRHRAWAWLIPAAAAASVLVVAAGLVLAAQAGHRTGSRTRATSAAIAGMPRYMVTYGDGLYFNPGGGPGYVRLTATGQVVARIRPVASYFTVEGLAAAPGDRTFYLIGEDTVHAPAGEVRIDCFKIVLGANGHPGVPQLLPGAPLLAPLPPTSNGATSIPLAVSPDGAQLAYPNPGAVPSGSPYSARPQAIIVQNVKTGARRSFTGGPAAGTQIGDMSWGADGRLGFVAFLGDAAVSHGAVIQDGRSELNVFMILNTKAAGSGLIADSRLVAWGSATLSVAGTPTPNPPPGPVAGLLSQDGKTAYLRIVARHGTARLVALSVATKRMTRDPVSGKEAGQAGPVAVDGHYLLLTLPILRPVRHGAEPWVNGHLAGVNLATGQIAVLPFPTYQSEQAPVAPLEAAW